MFSSHIHAHKSDQITYPQRIQHYVETCQKFPNMDMKKDKHYNNNKYKRDKEQNILNNLFIKLNR